MHIAGFNMWNKERAVFCWLPGAAVYAGFSAGIYYGWSRNLFLARVDFGATVAYFRGKPLPVARLRNLARYSGCAAGDGGGW